MKSSLVHFPAEDALSKFRVMCQPAHPAFGLLARWISCPTDCLMTATSSFIAFSTVVMSRPLPRSGTLF